LILLADGHIVYQGLACESAEYFDIKNKCGSLNRNPCDFFMRELAVNYPKKTEDYVKISQFCDKYDKEQMPKVKTEMLELKYGDLDVSNASNRHSSFKEQYKLL
jgi:hypothetical protein